MSFIPQSAPFVALPKSLRGRLTPNQLAVLWILQSYHPHIWPSYQRVADDAKLSRRQVLRVVAQLMELDLLQKKGRVNSNGQTSNVYAVTVWEDGEPCKDLGCHPVIETLLQDPSVAVRGDSQSPPPVTHSHPLRQPPVATRGDSQSLVTHSHPPSDSQSPEEEQLKKNKYLEEDPLKGPTPTAAKPEPKPIDPFAAKKLPIEAIPHDLLDCQELLPEFWDAKGGRRTERVFNRVCAKLRQWTPEVRRQALESAIASGWGDVFQPKGALGLPNGSSRRTQPSRVQPQEDYVAGIMALESMPRFNYSRTTK